jgi:hypothetical protein
MLQLWDTKRFIPEGHQGPWTQPTFDLLKIICTTSSYLFLPSSCCNKVQERVNFISICIFPYSTKTSFYIKIRYFMFCICIYVHVMRMVLINTLKFLDPVVSYSKTIYVKI